MTRSSSLTSAVVVQAAVHLADEQGIEAVTMRRLGTQVGVGAMALYNYVSDREALLDAMVAYLLDQLTPQLRPTASSRTGGRAAYLAATAHATRALALAHPWLIRLMVMHSPLAAALDSPLATPAALACTESVLAGLNHTDDVVSVRTVRAFGAFLLGQLLLEIPPPANRARPRNRRRAATTSPTRRAQLLSRLTPLIETGPAAAFERSLQLFLATIETAYLDKPDNRPPTAPVGATAAQPLNETKDPSDD